MKPTKFPQANMTLHKPETMTDEECEDLHVHRCLNQHALISCWRPTWRERLAIFFGHPVWLWVIGTDRHPPVSIEVKDPFKVDIYA